MKLKSLSDILQAHNPINVLNKGYTIIKDNNHNIISSKEEINKLEEINIVFKDGEIKGKFTSLN